MATNQDQGVDVVDHTAAAAYSSGDPVVLGAAGNVSVGIALTDIANGAVGAVAIRGTFNMTKVSGAVIAQGETVNWDASASAVDDNAATAATGDVEDFGIAMEAAGAGVTTIAVQLLPGNGAIT
jgi:predicted RecA/RadA family phage recombinase